MVRTNATMGTIFLAVLLAACGAPTHGGSDAGIDAGHNACDPDAGFDGGTTTEQPDRGGMHVPAPTPIEYDFSPPASGPHRPRWAKWGEYDSLPPERWVHNLEHGGIVFLYAPSADQATLDAMRDFAASRPDDDGGPFRYVLTSYPDLPSTIAVVAWTWVYEADCFDGDAVSAFVDEHYRQAPEDEGADGAFEDGWIGR